MSVRSRPLMTATFPSLDTFVPERGSAFIFGTSIEERSERTEAWRQALVDVRTLELIEPGDNQHRVRVDDGGDLGLRDEAGLRHFWATLPNRPVYLDITGMSHHVWAPLVRAAFLERLHDLRVVYVEPSSYQFSGFPIEGGIFDLSDRIRGISPLPGFVTLTRPRPDTCLVPFLGFEGARLAFVLEQVQPAVDLVVPIIGLPGFKAEYPFHSYLGNQVPLKTSGAWARAKYVRANCPFSALYELEELARQHPAWGFALALIGTKPHALGAVLFALRTRAVVELLYDHPIRKADRTAGADRALVYNIGAFFP
jgi:hypothetical protein